MLQKKYLSLWALIPLLITMSLNISAYSEKAEKISAGKEKFGDLTEKEHCILNLMLSYAEKDINKFSDLLHVDYSYWMGKEKKWGAQEEKEKTKHLFNNAKSLTIKIDSGSWDKVDDFLRLPCKNCWASTRAYTITSQLSDEGINYEGSGFTKYIITQVEGKYKILAIVDLGKELSQ